MPRGDFWPHWTERLRTNVLPTPSGCVDWQGSRNSKGYGVIWFEGKLHLAHRAAWLAEHGRWPTPGLVLDHICENKACVRVEHLRELTNGQNIQRAYPRGDAATEARRAAWRRSAARHRTKVGGPNQLV